MMKAIVYKAYGSSDLLELTELPKPQLQADEVLVRVKAFSINPRDTSLRKGEFKFLMNQKFPKLTGADFAGVVEEVGENVTSFKQADAVFGYLASLNTGVSAEFISVKEKDLTLKPLEVSFAEGSTLGCAYLTALQALRDKAKIKAGDQVLIYGASGGVGTAAIQLAKYFGANVTAVSHSKHQAYCLSLGADQFLAYDQEDVFSQNKNYDIFFQVYSTGGLYYDKAKPIMGEKSRFICLIPQPFYIFKKWFSKPAFDFVLVKNAKNDLQFLAERIKSNELTPIIFKEFSFIHTKEAHNLMERGQIQGKIVVNLE